MSKKDEKGQKHITLRKLADLAMSISHSNLSIFGNLCVKKGGGGYFWHFRVTKWCYKNVITRTGWTSRRVTLYI
jgi:hypothetical protein